MSLSSPVSNSSVNLYLSLTAVATCIIHPRKISLFPYKSSPSQRDTVNKTLAQIFSTRSISIAFQSSGAYTYRL
ncbi:hypothetical protein L1987_59100 [Smallanthus sonchifolius]|uniref:Uncharacterized protein n=1 Tax=Smallanthus sonchifolius TaxID=185202 RepID=A0ACB9D496_9ASTR|nr:hypothetical protein L1987_59100 [Smallanthus sonchifolius]